jgi:transposase
VDRDGVYASAARRGAPDALQVADRWHLVHNLADALERFAVRILAAVRKELKAGEAAGTTSPEIPPWLKAASLSLSRLKERTERRHAEIHELLTQGLTITAISRRLRLHRKTVYRFAAAEVAADLLGRGRRATAVDPYLPYMAKRWREGQHVAAFLFDEICKKGYRGSKRSVRRQVDGGRPSHHRRLT